MFTIKGIKNMFTILRFNVDSIGDQRVVGFKSFSTKLEWPKPLKNNFFFLGRSPRKQVASLS